MVHRLCSIIMHEVLRPVALMLFEILGFKLKNENNARKKDWRNRSFAMSVVSNQFFNILTLVIILW